jgi:hypothetical protein
MLFAKQLFLGKEFCIFIAPSLYLHNVNLSGLGFMNIALYMGILTKSIRYESERFIDYCSSNDNRHGIQSASRN